MECIEHFRTMQNCFREHPEIYGAELDDDEVAEVQAEEDRAQASLAQSSDAQAGTASAESSKIGAASEVQSSRPPAERTAEEGSELVPRASHDAR